MKTPDIPPNESERQAALCELGLLDTQPEERFDRITRIAQRYFGVQIALVSLVDARRQWFKSRQGLDATETPRDISFCGHTILAEDIFHVPNALNDPRFADNPLVTGDPEIRFYAGAPLHAPGGERVGTLCVIDGRARELSPADRDMLRDLADAVQVELENVRLRQTQIQLNEAQQRLNAVINTVADGIISIENSGLISTFNPAAERIFGYAATEVIGRNVSMLMPEPFHSHHNGYLDNYLNTGTRKIIGIGRDVVGQRKDGSTFPMHLAVDHMRIGDAPMFTGIVRDITERKKAEAEAMALSLRLNLALASAQLGVWDWDIANNALVWDDRMHALFEISPEAFGRTHEALLKMLHADDRARCDQDMRAALRGENPYDAEFRVCWPDGTVHWIKTSGKILRDDTGRAVRMVGISFDNTARKESEIALRESEHLLSESQRIAGIGSWSWDFTTPIRWTSEAYRIHGVAPESFIPTPESLVALVHPEDRLAMQAWMQSCRNGEQPGELQFRIVWPDGTIRFLSGCGEAKFDTQNRAIFLSGTVQDITARKHNELILLEARNAAELANRAKDAFLATMSHEIRTPLGGMLGMLEMISLSPLNPDQVDTLGAARDCGSSLLRILNDILDLSKIEAGKLDLLPRATSISELMAEVVNTYSHVANVTNVSLALQADARLSPAHMVDPLRLSQVLNNFMSNAIKFSLGGRVELRVEWLGRQADSEQLRFSVQDTGIGIDQEVQKRLFHRYDQASPDTAHLYGGTGLGLAICSHLAELLQGRIDLDSAPGQGSTFSLTLTLPIAQAELPASRISAEINSAVVTPFDHGGDLSKSPIVLVADDQSINRRLLVRQLDLLGLRSEAVEDGELALARWRSGGVSLVITDCHMPNMDGYALAHAIRAIETAEALARTPIVAWTANDPGEEVGRCLSAGIDRVLGKPTELPQLKRVIADCLSARTHPPETNAVGPCGVGIQGRR